MSKKKKGKFSIQKIIDELTNILTKIFAGVLFFVIVYILIYWWNTLNNLDFNAKILSTTSIVVFTATLSLLSFQYRETFDRKKEKANFDASSEAGKNFLNATILFVFSVLTFVAYGTILNNPLIPEFLNFIPTIILVFFLMVLLVSIISFINGLLSIAKTMVEVEEE